jgi:hypothetical protein
MKPQLGRQIDDRNEWRREQLRLKAKAYDESEQAIKDHKAALQREHEEERERIRLDRLDKERQITEVSESAAWWFCAREEHMNGPQLVGTVMSSFINTRSPLAASAHNPHKSSSARVVCLGRRDRYLEAMFARVSEACTDGEVGRLQGIKRVRRGACWASAIETRSCGCGSRRRRTMRI